MRKIFAVFMLLALTASVSFAEEAVPGDVIVVLRKPGALLQPNSAGAKAAIQSTAQSFAQSSRVQVAHTYDSLSQASGNVFMVVHSDTEDENTLLQRIRSNPDVVAASLNRIYTLDLPESQKTPNDPEYYRLWGMEAINAPQAWTQSTGSQDVYVVVMDSGVDYNHPDLKDNFSHEYSRNFVGYNQNNYDPSAYYDQNNHGTHVAGTIAAIGNNALGVAGVNWRAKIISLRVLDAAGTGSTEATVAALNYLTGLLALHTDMSIAAMNYSVGGPQTASPEQMMAYNEPEFLAWKVLGDTDRIIMCMAAGNDTIEVGAPTPSTVYNSNTGKLSWNKGSYEYPGSYIGLHNRIVVASASQDLKPSSFTNYSSKFVDIAAPGTDIFSTLPVSLSNDLGYARITNTYPYGLMSGTSMATPHVTGAATLLKTIFPEATASQIRSAIIGSANSDYLRDDGTSSYGMLDVAGAINFLARTLSSDTVPVLTGVNLPAGVVGQRYMFEFHASGHGPITWSFDGKLPDGIDSDDGFMIGTPKESGNFPFIVTATNANGSSSLVLNLMIVDAIAPVIDESTMSYDTTVSVDCNITLNTKQGSWPVLWLMDSSDISADLMPVLNPLTGVLACRAKKAGTFSFDVTASNDAGRDTKTFTLNVTEAKPPVISGDILADGIPGRPYGAKYALLEMEGNTTITAEGTRPISWKVTGLPKGLEFEQADRADSPGQSMITIYGRPESADVYTLTVTASNDYGTTSRDFVITVSDREPRIMIPTLDTACYKGENFSLAFPVRGSSPISIDWSGDIPDGTSIDCEDNTAILHGIPTKTGSYTFTLTATNAFGSHSRNWPVDVKDLISITPYFLPDAVKGRSYNASVRTLNDVAVDWEISADASLGLAINKSGDITGLPSETGIFSVDVTASETSRTFTVIVRELPAITTESLPDGRAGAPYEAVQLQATGTTPLTWSISDGEIPGGLTLSENGYFYGTPTESGPFTFSIMAENKAGYDSQTFTVRIASSGTVDPSPDVTPEPEPKPESHDDKPDIPPVTISEGLPRDISSLTIGELAAIVNAEGVIAAVLPEIRVNYPGFYTFESIDAFANVRLSDDVSADLFLVWNAFTRGGVNKALSIEDAEDDNVQFYDSDGNITITVPENHIVNVSAWLDADTVYAPVISATRKEPETQGVASSSGGGCSAMMPGVMLLGLCAFMLRGKSRKGACILLMMGLVACASGAYAGEVLAVLRTPEGMTLTAESLQSGAIREYLDKTAESAGAKIISIFDSLSLANKDGHIFVFIASDGKTSEQLASKLKENPNVISASPNRKVSLPRPVK